MIDQSVLHLHNSLQSLHTHLIQFTPFTPQATGEELGSCLNRLALKRNNFSQSAALWPVFGQVIKISHAQFWSFAEPCSSSRALVLQNPDYCQ